MFGGAVGGDGADDRRVRLREHLLELVGERWLGHARLYPVRTAGAARRDRARGREVDLDRVGDVRRVAAGERDADRRSRCARRCRGRARRAPRRPAFVSARRPRRSPSHGSAPARKKTRSGWATGTASVERVRERAQVLVVAGAGAQVDVEVGRRAVERVVRAAVERQRVAARVAREQLGRAVALVDVAVDDERAAERALGPQRGDRDGDVVEQAVAAALRVRGVVRSAAEVHAEAVRRARRARRGPCPASSAGRARRAPATTAARARAPRGATELAAAHAVEVVARRGPPRAAPTARPRSGCTAPRPSRSTASRSSRYFGSGKRWPAGSGKPWRSCDQKRIGRSMERRRKGSGPETRLHRPMWGPTPQGHHAPMRTSSTIAMRAATRSRRADRPQARRLDSGRRRTAPSSSPSWTAARSPPRR